MRHVALDLAARKIVFVEVSEQRVVQRRTVGSLASLADVLGERAAPAVVAIEACREAWHVHDTLEAWGHRVVVVDTTKVKRLGIGQHGKKTDRIDAEVLAMALERGGIPVAHVLSKPSRKLRVLLGMRRGLVESRSQLVTTVRGMVRAEGQALPACDAETFVERVRRQPPESTVMASIEPALHVLDRISIELLGVEAQLEEQCKSEPVIERLTSAPGVGLIVAAAFVSVVDEAKRFGNAHKLEAYLGLVPSENSSGDKRRLGAITKQGNSYLRSLLVQASWVILRSADRSDPLRRWGEAVARRRGKRIAVVAVARRLAGVLWAMWRHGTLYEPGRLAEESAGGLHRQAQSTEAIAAGMKRAADKTKRRARLSARQTERCTQAAARQTETR